MNTILLENSDFTSPGRVVLSDYRLEHMRKVLKSAPGSRCKVGLLGGNLGTGEVLTIDAESAELQITLDTPPPQNSTWCWRALCSGRRLIKKFCILL